MKMPDPMMPPITIIVASNRPSARLKITKGSRSSAVPCLCDDNRSWIEAFDAPSARLAHIDDAVVETIGPAVPELDSRRNEAEAAPKRRPLHRLALESPLHLTILFFERLSRGERLALLGCPRAELAATWPASEVLVGFVAGDAAHLSLDADLFVERGPVDAQRRVRIIGELATLPA